MTTLLVIFCLALALALALTPVVARLARRARIVDMPSDRSVHIEPMPRAGGVAIYLAFYLTFLPALFYQTKILDLLFQEPRLVYLVLGGCVAFGLGLWDDIVRVDARVKLAVQTLAALIVYYGGIRISTVSIPGLYGPQELGWLGLPATVLWVLVVMNAINLTDGLDGLAAGVSFFVAMVLLVLCVLNERFLVAMSLAALAGATLGFLWHNFNPATIFLGDAGSYFLGYMLAALSMLGSIKSQAAVTILIPMIALGVPLMDTFWSALRRFAKGQKIFVPDREHFHHRLLSLGYTHRRAVLTLYGITVCLGVMALMLVNLHDERAALLLLLVGLILIGGIRKLGYLDYLAAHRFTRWVRNVSDELGLRQARRVFLAKQVALLEARSVDEFWERLVSAGAALDLTYLELNLEANGLAANSPARYQRHFAEGRFDPGSIDPLKTLYMNIPLSGDGAHFGSLLLIKDLPAPAAMPPEMLRRIESLRRSAWEALTKLAGKEQRAGREDRETSDGENRARGGVSR